MSPPAENTRGARRFSVNVRASISPATGPPRQATTRDLSRSGICLIGLSPLARGEAIKIQLVLALSENTFSEPLRLEARVVWCAAIADSFQIGAMFEGVSQEQDSYLEIFLQYLDGTLRPKDASSSASGERPPSPDEKDDPFKN